MRIFSLKYSYRATLIIKQKQQQQKQKEIRNMNIRLLNKNIEVRKKRWKKQQND